MRIVIPLLLCLACGPAPTPVPADPASGGATTVRDASANAYTNRAPNSDDAHADAFSLGHSLFERNWVSAPATTADIDGLGPRFNQRSCSSCHAHDGRAEPFARDGSALNLLFRLSVDGEDDNGGPRATAGYGGQVRPNAIQGLPGDALVKVRYDEQAGSYGDGTAYSLRVPSYGFSAWSSGDPGAFMFSPRVGPATFGLGLLEAIPEDQIRAHSGKPNLVWDVQTQTLGLGRFGWKANVPSVRMQSAGAFSGDMGITSSLFPTENCAPSMTACLAAKSGGSPEIDDERLAAVSTYMRTLAVPARRNTADASALAGEKLFAQYGCESCHVSTFTTGDIPDFPELSGQTIHPYTDLLLHDMGPGLKDGRPDYLATGSEWRTAPLWGIGLLRTVNGHEFLLHDARARGIEEAILWHGGEAIEAREKFRTAKARDRNALLAFLRSL